MNRCRLAGLIVAVSLLAAATVRAQTTDSVAVVTPSGVAIPVVSAPNRARSPRVAMIRSAVLPGWGQVYNGKAWKAPIIGAAAVGLTLGWLSDNRAFRATRRQVIDSLAAGRGSTPAVSQLILRRDSQLDSRDNWVWYGALAYAIQLADAYVDAQLSDFDATPPVATVRPTTLLTPDGRLAPALTLSLRW